MTLIFLYFWKNHNIALKVATNEWETDLKLLLPILLGFADLFNIDHIFDIRPSSPVQFWPKEYTLMAVVMILRRRWMEMMMVMVPLC